ncbi:hypothetical protein PENSPDRAFT_749655 [Peniophora sp. CONT]|nr:hypothetical protein PENSPDRAFT_749655 [Peniophora sp. CONT]
MGVVLLLLFLLTSACAGFAHHLTVPADWVSTSSSDTRDVRGGYASGAAQALVDNLSDDGSLYDETDGQALASMYSALALQDVLTGNTTWEEPVSHGMRAWARQNDVYGNGTDGSLQTNSNSLQWALAYYYAYMAYSHTDFLMSAQDIWDAAYTDFITPEMITDPLQVPAPPDRDSTWLDASGCFDDSTSGGVFLVPNVTHDSRIRMDTVGPFAALAGYLYNETQDDTYQVAGLQAINFLSGLTDPASGLQYGEVRIHTCENNTGSSPGYQGWHILPLSIWADITQDGKLLQTLQSVVSDTVQPSTWVSSDGVLTDPDPDEALSDNSWDDKAILIRALSETLTRLDGASDLQTLIQAFLTIQYSNLVQNAQSGNFYSTALDGPPPQSYTSDGNIVALDVLNAALNIPPGDAPTSPSAPSTQTSSSADDSGSIAGAVVGIVLFAILLFCFWRWHRRHPRTIAWLSPVERPITVVYEPRYDAAPNVSSSWYTSAPAAVPASEPPSYDAAHLASVPNAVPLSTIPESTNRHTETSADALSSESGSTLRPDARTRYNIRRNLMRLWALTLDEEPPQMQDSEATADSQRPQSAPPGHTIFSQPLEAQTFNQPQSQASSPPSSQRDGADEGAAGISGAPSAFHPTPGRAVIWSPSVTSRDSDGSRILGGSRHSRVMSGEIVAGWQDRLRRATSSGSNLNRT